MSVKSEGEIYTFQTEDIDEIVEARMEEIMEAVQKELKKAGRAEPAAKRCRANGRNG